MDWPPIDLPSFIESDAFALGLRQLKTSLANDFKIPTSVIEEATYDLIVDALKRDLNRKQWERDEPVHPLIDFTRFSSPNAWWAYLRISSRRRAVRSLRSRQSTVELPSDLPDSRSETPLEHLLQQLDLKQLIDRLPMTVRLVIQGFQDGKTNKELADELGVSPSRISQLFKTGVGEIQRRLRTDSREPKE